MAEGGEPAHPHNDISNFTEPLQCLQSETRRALSLKLNIRLVSGNDWKLLAHRLGCTNDQINNIENKDDFTRSVLLHAIGNDVTVGRFVQILHEMDRDDVIEECRSKIVHDVEVFSRPIQHGQVSSPTSTALTRRELKTGQKEFFDAFVSYHPQDRSFLTKLMDKLETEHGFKLFISERNLCVGVRKNTTILQAIQQRCKRVIILLSKDYTDGEMALTWEMELLQDLASATKDMHKLVPIRIELDVKVPDILRMYATCEYNENPPFCDWFWDSIYAALDAPTNDDECGYSGPQGRLGRSMRVDQ